MRILVTGAAGFIGFHVALALKSRGDDVVGVDCMSDYYDVTLKEARSKLLHEKGIKLIVADVSKKEDMDKIFEGDFDKICHLAAQAGVRHSLEKPLDYEINNSIGTLLLLEEARHRGIKDFIYASSSSVYGKNEKTPFSESDAVELPVSMYAATKRYNELTAHVYHHLFKINCTGLRFFTVYGPYGRPDMALFTFVKKMLAGEPIDVYNSGKMQRDFTYISDIVAGVIAAIDKAYACEIFNLGGDNPVELLTFIEIIEKELGIEAKKNLMPMQPGDVVATMADVSKARKMLGYDPKVSIEEGIRQFITWYKKYYAVLE